MYKSTRNHVSRTNHPRNPSPPSRGQEHRQDVPKDSGQAKRPGRIDCRRAAKTNGFNRPNDISEKLTAFLGVEPGTQMSRSDVTKFVNAYIADKNLKAPPPNGRNIVLDDKLRDLLEPGEQQVTFLNLQRFLSKHIIKKST